MDKENAKAHARLGVSHLELAKLAIGDYSTMRTRAKKAHAALAEATELIAVEAVKDKQAALKQWLLDAHDSRAEQFRANTHSGRDCCRQTTSGNERCTRGGDDSCSELDADQAADYCGWGGAKTSAVQSRMVPGKSGEPDAAHSAANISPTTAGEALSASASPEMSPACTNPLQQLQPGQPPASTSTSKNVSSLTGHPSCEYGGDRNRPSDVRTNDDRGCGGRSRDR